jgi:hypothetical protein
MINNADSAPWTWEVSTNAEQVHALLRACDAYTAAANVPPPERKIETTRRYVQMGSVHILRRGLQNVGMFTLTWEPTFDQDLTIFPQAEKVVYLARLAVQPEYLERGSIVGARCVRKAIELALDQGAEAIRCEANPDLVSVFTLLDLFGFRQYGPTLSHEARRRVYLQKSLTPRA